MEFQFHFNLSAKKCWPQSHKVQGYIYHFKYTTSDIKTNSKAR